MAIGLLAPYHNLGDKILFANTCLTSGKLGKYASSHLSSKSKLNGFRVRAIKEKTEEMKLPTSSSSSSAEEITQKYGLEAGLWKVPQFFSLLYSVSCFGYVELIN